MVGLCPFFFKNLQQLLRWGGGVIGWWGWKRRGRGSKAPNIQFEKPKYSNVNDPSAARPSLRENKTPTNRLTLSRGGASDHSGGVVVVVVVGEGFTRHRVFFFQMFHDAPCRVTGEIQRVGEELRAPAQVEHWRLPLAFLRADKSSRWELIDCSTFLQRPPSDLQLPYSWKLT